MLKAPLSSVLLPLDATIREVAERMNATGVGMVLALDDDGRLAGVLTDGDVRRAALRFGGFGERINAILADEDTALRRSFLAAPFGTAPEILVRTMRQHGIRHLPLLDEEGRPVDLALLDELLASPTDTPPLDDTRAVVMAGGFGTRLRPLTDDIPKPMLPVGDRPLLEIIVSQLRQSGITDITLSTFFHAEMIHRHFGDGSKFGVRIGYLSEEEPLGTAGALSLLPRPPGPLLVLNGDILTHSNFAALLAFHRKNDAAMTVGSYHYEMSVPYGVLTVEGYDVRSVQEKPKLSFLVNAGIYVLSPRMFDFLPRGKHCNMTDLIEKAMSNNLRVSAFPIVEYWRDIGRVSDYLQAIKDHERTRGP
ncbi:MAG: nucleotidyltransferase family protein [Pseudomonadota bacterium]